MATSRNDLGLKFSSPANYRICVKGFLDESWSERLVGMTLKNLDSTEKIPIVSLSGPVRDQTELFGLLNSLYEMHLPIVSIELVNSANDK